MILVTPTVLANFCLNIYSINEAKSVPINDPTGYDYFGYRECGLRAEIFAKV